MIVVGTGTGLVALEGGARRELSRGVVIAMDGQWAVAEQGETITSLDSGVLAPVDAQRALCVADAGDRFYVGTAGAHVLVGRADTAALERVESFDRIPTREEWYTPWGAPPDTRSIACSAEGALLVNVHVGGVWRSADGDNDRWDEVIDVDADTHQVVADAERGIVVTAAAVGVGVSLDNGVSWAWTDDGLHASYCRAAAIAGDTLVVTASTGPRTSDGRIFRRPLKASTPLEQCRAGLPERFPFNLDTGQLAARDDDVAVGTSDGRVFLSGDAGNSWELVADGLGEVRCLSFSSAAI